jgi:hypothetical protein
MAKVYIATPMYGGVCSGQFTKSLISLFFLLKNNGHQVLFSDIYNESLITRARNTLTAMFLKTDSDYLLFIDADQGFDANAVVKMISENVDLVGAAVPMKAINWERVRRAAKEDQPDLSLHSGYYNINTIKKEDLLTIKDNPQKLLEVANIGTGLLLISRKVFEDLSELVGEYKSDQLDIGDIKKGDIIKDYWQTSIDQESKRLFSEDYKFCKMWRDLGNKVYLAPYVRVTHAGSYIFK